MPRLCKKCTIKSEWTKNTAIYVCGQRGRECAGIGEEAAEKVAKGANMLHKFAYNCLNLAWCFARVGISIWREWGEGLSWPRVAFATCKTCPTCVQHMQQLLLSQLLRTSGKFTLLRQCGVVCVACLPVCVCVCVCMLTISCAVNVFLLYLQHSTPTPHHAHFLCHLKSHWCAIRVCECCCCKALQAASCFPLALPLLPAPSALHLACHSTGKSAWAVYMRVMFVACFESYVKHLTPSKWMLLLLLLLLWQSAHDNSLIENMFHICLRMGDWERQQEHPRLINVPKGLAVHIICLVSWVCYAICL